MNLLPPVGESIESLDVDAPDAMASGKETAGGSSKVGSDICVVLNVLQTAVSVTTVVSEKWMKRFILNLDDLRSDVLASGENPFGGSSDVGSDVCVAPDPLPTVVSVRTEVAMEWFVLDLVECPSVSRTSAVARTFGPAVSEEYSPVVFAGGGGGRLPMHTSWLSLSQIQCKYMSCLLPVVRSRPFFWGRSPWMWSVWALARRVSEWIRRKPC